VFSPFQAIFTSATRFSPFYECVAFLPFWANFTSVPRLYHFELFYECTTFLPFWGILTSWTHFYYLEPCLQVCCVFIILSHILIYECSTFWPFWVIFTSVPRFCPFEPFLRVRYVFTILTIIMHLSSASPKGEGDPGLMWENTGTLWGLCNKIPALLVGEMWGLKFLNAFTLGENVGTSLQCNWEEIGNDRLFTRRREEE